MCSGNARGGPRAEVQADAYPGTSLFRDWGAAADQPFLPTTAEAVALFLEEVPAAASTSLKRIQAIRHAHREKRLTMLV